MFELIRENVVRIVATENERDALLQEGFVLVGAEREQQQEKPENTAKIKTGLKQRHGS